MTSGTNTAKWRTDITRHWALPALGMLLVIVSWTSILDAPAEDYLSDSIVSAGAIYAVARSINGTVSVIQSGQLSVGVASISPGELLDPINDLIERFSGVMTFAIASLGLQKVLLTIVENNIFNVLLTLAAITYLFLRGAGSPWSTVGLKILLTLLVIRFSLAFIVLANATFSSAFIDQQINQYQAELKTINTELSDIEAGASQSGGSPASMDDIKKKIHDQQQELAKYTETRNELGESLEKQNAELAKQKKQAGCDSWRSLFCEGSNAIKKKKAEIASIEHSLQAAEDNIASTRDRLDELSDQLACAEKRSNGEECSVGDWIGKKMQVLNIRRSVRKITASSSAWFDNIITLLVLLILKAIVLPLVFWAILYGALKRIWRKPSDVPVG